MLILLIGVLDRRILLRAHHIRQIIDRALNPSSVGLYIGGGGFSRANIFQRPRTCAIANLRAGHGSNGWSAQHYVRPYQRCGVCNLEMSAPLSVCHSTRVRFRCVYCPKPASTYLCLIFLTLMRYQIFCITLREKHKQK